MSINAVPSIFGVMAKPAGSGCNLKCDYCYYLEKQKLYNSTSPLMEDETIELFIKQYIQSQESNEIQFVWQGGEPALLGVEYFNRIVELQKKYAGKARVFNAFQTNGTLIDLEWARFLKKNNFLVGISIDGPQHIHDYYRKYRNGNSSFDDVMQGIELLKSHRVEFNTLSVVNRYSEKFPLEVYSFMKKVGSSFMQFLPAVERLNAQSNPAELQLTHQKTKDAEITDWSVTPKGYGNFLKEIFDHWVRKDVGKTFVQMFDVTLANWMGKNPGLCVHKDYCGDALVIERNGDVYACDHFVYPEYSRRNIHEKSLREMFFSKEQISFGLDKKKSLSINCRACDFRFACHGDCPKHRFVDSGKDSLKISYLCPGLKEFFHHVKPAMDFMSNELKNHRPPSNIMNNKV